MTPHINFLVIAFVGFLALTLWYFYLGYVKTTLKIKSLKTVVNPNPTNGDVLYWQGIQTNARKKFLMYLAITILIGILNFTRILIILPPAK